MDPLTSATLFATIVSLIGQFRSERSNASNTIETSEFMSWLSTNSHEDIKQMLESNTSAIMSIKSLLSINHEVLIEKLECLDKALATYASVLPEFSNLANNLRPNTLLSDQAINILKQFHKSNGSKILEMRMQGYLLLQIIDGNGGQIEAEDQRFVEDDLKTLVEHRLLRHELNSSGKNMYIFTRVASNFVDSLNAKL